VTDSAVAVSMEELLQIADAGLYRSKQDGRDRVTVAEDLSKENTPDDAPADEPVDVVAPAKGHREGHLQGAEAASGKGAANGNGSANGKRATTRRRTKLPALHQAADEPDPRATGLEIR
jgi:hypothetical protein